MHGHKMSNNGTSVIRVVAWEMTRACPLKCRHCRAEAVIDQPEGELTTEEAKEFIDDLASSGPCLLILTGGEPMMRPDMLDLAQYADSKKLRVVAAPCGKYLNEKSAEKMINAGIKRISLSIDGATAESHNNLRGLDGAFAMVTEACREAKKTGLEFQINTTVHAGNAGELEDISRLVLELGAVGWDLFLLVPTGRGRGLTGQELDAPAYEKTLCWIRDKALAYPLPIKVTCAPHYVRIAEEAGLKGTPCLGGKSFVFVSHRGEVQICGFLDVPAGNIRKEKLSKIWKDSALFQELRDYSCYKGKCGVCEFVKRCGGCRARAYASTGDYLGPEPYCTYIPAEKNK
ncbi:MAG: radical SAM protein [Planctomycetota bacterium]